MGRFELDTVSRERLGRLRAEVEAAQLRAHLAEQTFAHELERVCRALGVEGAAALKHDEGVILTEGDLR